jgi:hypothetical protein
MGSPLSLIRSVKSVLGPETDRWSSGGILRPAAPNTPACRNYLVPRRWSPERESIAACSMVVIAETILWALPISALLVGLTGLVCGIDNILQSAGSSRTDLDFAAERR